MITVYTRALDAKYDYIKEYRDGFLRDYYLKHISEELDLSYFDFEFDEVTDTSSIFGYDTKEEECAVDYINGFEYWRCYYGFI
jgi:hypothetical protein